MIILKIKDVVELTKIGRSTIYSWVKAGKFPPQIKLGQKSSGWIEEEVLRWIQDRIDQRNHNYINHSQCK